MRWRSATRCTERVRSGGVTASVAALSVQRCGSRLSRHYLESLRWSGCQEISQTTPMISVDLELTGLDANSNQIISMGWTLIDGGRVQHWLATGTC